MSKATRRGLRLSFSPGEAEIRRVQHLLVRNLNWPVIKGAAFSVYGPPEYLNDPEPLRAGIYERLADTKWMLVWGDGRTDELRFGLILVFLKEAARADAIRQSILAGMDVDGGFDVEQIVKDETIRELLTSSQTQPVAWKSSAN